MLIFASISNISKSIDVNRFVLSWPIRLFWTTWKKKWNGPINQNIQIGTDSIPPIRHVSGFRHRSVILFYPAQDPENHLMQNLGGSSSFFLGFIFVIQS